MRFRVYLSGPITGLTGPQASDWRAVVGKKLTEHGIRVLNPLRGGSYLSSQVPDIGKSQEALLSDKALMRRDKADVYACDVFFANLIDTKQVSVGTLMEMAWAEDHNKIVVVAMNNDMHDHPFVRESAIIFKTLQRAIDYILSCVDENFE